MIKITIELIPSMQPWKSKVIGRAKITNAGTGTEKRGNYFFELYGKRKQPLKLGYVSNFPRKSYNVWRLIKRVLNEI